MRIKIQNLTCEKLDDAEKFQGGLVFGDAVAFLDTLRNSPPRQQQQAVNNPWAALRGGPISRAYSWWG